MNTDLWSGMRIPIILVSGPVNSGKSLFLLTIDGNCRKPQAEVEPTTLVYDQEGSCEPYVGGLNFEWRDTRAAVAAGVHRETVAADPTDPRWLKILKENADCNDSPSAAMFRAWYLSILKVPVGRYIVGGCDTFTPLEAGMVEWLRRHPEAFGRTFAEYQKASSMFLWPDAKAMLSHILTVDCRLRFETFVLNVHLKNEWAGGSKTGKQVAEGLDVLQKLATLHLELDRSPKEKGKDAPRVPAAIVKKERLVRFSPDGNDLPVLPPRIPECNPQAIRAYIQSPPDLNNLKPGERLPDQSLTDDEKLRMQAAIAADNRATEENKLSALELARQAMERGRTVAGGAGNEPVSSVQTDAPPPAAARPESITALQMQEMLGVMKQLFATGAEAVAWLGANYETDNPAALNSEQATNILIELTKRLAEKKISEVKTPAPGVQSTDGPATPEQRARIKELTIAVHGDSAAAAQSAFLQGLGRASAQELTFCEAQQRILELQGMEGAAKETPF